MLQNDRVVFGAKDGVKVTAGGARRLAALDGLAARPARHRRTTHALQHTLDQVGFDLLLGGLAP